MADDFRTYTRVDRFEKKRKNTKAISWLLFIGGLFVVALISLFIFGPDDTDGPAQTVTGEEQSNEDANQSNNDLSTQEDIVTDENTSTEDDGVSGVPPNEGETQLEQLPSDDENVLEAYTGNWQPVGTEQQGPHNITFEQGSQDWKEMMEAVRVATGLASDDMIQWWVERAGDQQVKATVSNRSETEIYRVYVSWVDSQGWMPTKVERLKENDQKYRFEDDSSQEQPESSE